MAHAYDALRRLILEGELRPGARATQSELAEQIGCGRTPLREALRMLERDGFIVATTNHGVRVAEVTVEAIEDLYAMRLLLEPPLLGGLAGSMSEPELEELDRLVDAMEALTDRPVKEFQAAHSAFHSATHRALGDTVTATLVALYERLGWLQRAYMSRHALVAEYVAIDREIVAALRSGEGPRARALLELHMLDAAIGVVLEVDPDHRFDRLLVAARGIGIDIPADPDGRLRPPVAMTWPGGSAAGLTSTANVTV